MGGVFRQTLGKTIYSILFHRFTIFSKTACISIWTTIVIIFPYRTHDYIIPFYLWGIACGIFLHKAVHIWYQNRIETFRRIQNIYHNWPSEKHKTNEESELLSLLKKRKWRKLRNKLDAWEVANNIDFTKRLFLFSASLYRISGDYPNSINVIEKATNDEINDEEDVHLLLIKAINHRDLNENIKSQDLLDRLVKSQIGRNCPFIHATIALLLGEEALEDPLKANFTKVPLSWALKSIEFRKQQANINNSSDMLKDDKNLSFLSKFLDFSVPITGTLILDVLGYSFLASGYLFEAKVIFADCISFDPSYTSAYLHLGDYFFVKGVTLANHVQKTDCFWHAKLCFQTAYNLESVKKSRIASIAQNRLSQLKTVI